MLFFLDGTIRFNHHLLPKTALLPKALCHNNSFHKSSHLALSGLVHFKKGNFIDGDRDSLKAKYGAGLGREATIDNIPIIFTAVLNKKVVVREGGSSAECLV